MVNRPPKTYWSQCRNIRLHFLKTSIFQPHSFSGYILLRAATPQFLQFWWSAQQEKHPSRGMSWSAVIVFEIRHETYLKSKNRLYKCKIIWNTASRVPCSLAYLPITISEKDVPHGLSSLASLLVRTSLLSGWKGCFCVFFDCLTQNADILVAE